MTSQSKFAITVLYQGDCSFCNWSRRFVKRRDNKNQINFIAINSDVGNKLILKNNLSLDRNKPKTIVAIDHESRIFTKWRAVMEILRHLNKSMRLLRLILLVIPNTWGDKIYYWSSRNRGLLCRLVRCGGKN